MNWYLTVLKKYATFSGRARRKEYWMFLLFHILFLIVASIIDNIAGTTMSNSPYGLIYILYGLFIFMPSLAVSVRRLHDINKSGWWIFISLIPLIGGIWLIVLQATEGDSGSNEYGNDPKSEGNDINNDDTLDSHMV